MRTPSCTLSLFTLIILSACAVQPARPPAAAAMSKVQNLAFIEQYAATSAFRLGQPKALTPTPQGDAVLFLRSTGPTSFVQDLWLFDASTGEERVLLTAEQVLAGNAEVLTTEELARRERLRMSSRGIASFELADDGNRLLVPLSGRLFVIDITSRVLPKVRELKSDAGYPIDPRFTPDGQRVVCVRDNDLYVIDVDSGGETRLTTGGSETVSNGTAEFVAQEEMDRRRGFWLTPDHVVYQQTDTSKVEKFTIADAANPGKPAQSWRYPRAGRANADVRLGVMPLAGGPTAWLEWDHAAYPYLARVYCGEDSPLCILVQNREQTEQRLVRFDAPDRPVTLLTETDPAWINLSGAHWLKGTGEFLWTTEQGAAGAKDRARLELRAHDGTLLRTLIDGDADFAVAGVDWEGSCAVVTRAWDYSANQVWRYPVRGGEPRPLGELTPHAFHAPVLSKHSDLWVCSETYPDGRGAVVVGRGGLARGTARIIGEIRSVAAQPPFMPAPEFTTAWVGGLDLNAAIIRPRGFDAGKTYPVLDAVYGGPGHGVVTGNPRGYLLHQWFADQGFIVVAIDARGTPGRGRAFERATKGNLIDVPLAEHAAALGALCARYKEMDASRIGVYGWSFGGYFTVLATERRPDVFRAGVAVAPVADWRDYDTHYTERYMGLPEANKAGYDAASALTYAKDLSVPLLIMHGTADDNVYTVNSLRLTDALFRAGKPFEFVPLSGFAHAVNEPAALARLWERAAGFFARNLGGPR